MHSIVKNQHFVPRNAYLKNFCNSKGRFYAYDKNEKKSFATQPKSVAVEHFFYDFPTEEDKEEQRIESFFSDIESKQSIFLNSFFCKVEYHLKNLSLSCEMISKEDKANFAHIIALQFMRTREHRKFILEHFKSTQDNLETEADKIYSQIISQLSDIVPPESKSLFESFWVKEKEGCISRLIDYVNWLYSEEGISIVQGEQIFRRCFDFANILMNHIWVLGFNTFKQTPFYTSDHPVAKVPLLSGIASSGVQISFPINSEMTILLFEREDHRQYETVENQIMLLTKVQIDNLNAQQVFSSDRQIYCRKNNFKLAETIIADGSLNLSSNNKRRY